MTDTLTTDWTINWRGSTWTSADLTAQHVAVVAELMDIAPPWDWFNAHDLHPALGPLQMVSLIAAFTIVDQRVVGIGARRAVLEATKEATVDELLASLELS